MASSDQHKIAIIFFNSVDSNIMDKNLMTEIMSVKLHDGVDMNWHELTCESVRDFYKTFNEKLAIMVTVEWNMNHSNY